MNYIFLDESGCLGFDFSKKKTSQYFIISFLFIQEHQKRPLEKIIKNIHRRTKTQSNSLHCCKENQKTRIQVLNKLKEHSVIIMTIYLNKRKVYTKLQDSKSLLYNYVVNILLDRILTRKLIPNEKDPVCLIASRRETNRFLNENFSSYLEKQAQKNHGTNIKVYIKPPQAEKCLQIIDFVCWAIFRKYEHNDDYYANLIKSLIVEENGLFT